MITRSRIRQVIRDAIESWHEYTGDRTKTLVEIMGEDYMEDFIGIIEQEIGGGGQQETEINQDMTVKELEDQIFEEKNL